MANVEPESGKKAGSPASKKAAGSRRGPGRPSTPVISAGEVVQKALDIIDRDGIEKLSMRGLGRELGVSGQSLYYHFADKDQLMQEVIKLILRDLRVPSVDEGTWQDHIMKSSIAYRNALLAHPNAAPLMVWRPWRGYAHGVLDAAVRLSERGGVPASRVLLIFRAAEMMSFASALFSSYSDNDGYGEVSDRYPALLRAIAEDSMPRDDAFKLTIAALIEGLARPEPQPHAPQQP